MKLTFLSQVVAECMWRALRWACDPKPNVVIAALKHAFKWRSTKWWQTTKAIELKTDPYNHTGWKHMWGWHNRGCVWDKIASEWSGKEE